MADELKRVIYLGKTIDDASAGTVITKLMELDMEDPKKPIRFVVNTYGGYMDAQFAIYDAVRVCAAPVVTIGIGKIMSAGVLLLACGEKGERLIARNARVMIHELSAGGWGKVSEIENGAKEERRQQQQWEQLIAHETGKSVGEVRAVMDRHVDQFMTAREAKAFGIVDRVM